MSRIGRVALLGSLFGVAASLAAEVVTLPAAASIQGGNPFFSDVRVFNTSYSNPLNVTATYQCFIAGAGAAGGACPMPSPSVQFTLAPRESRAFDDMIANADGFNAHDTAGGVEFQTTGSDGQLVVTSRLFSTFPQNTVGMFIPGLRSPRAFATSVLTSIRHDPVNGVGIVAGFRTNVGAFNPGDTDANASFVIFDGGQQAAPAVSRTVPAHSGVQVSGIFEAAGLPNLATSNAVIVVTANVPLYTYAAVIDNRTADPIFVQGAPDQSPNAPTPTPTQPGAPTATPTQPGAPSPTRTPTSPAGPTATRTQTLTRTPTVPGATMTPTQPGAPTATPTAPGPTLTPTSPGSTPTFTNTVPPTNTRTPTRTPTATPTPLPNEVDIFNDFFQDQTSGNSTTTITVGSTVNWVWKTGTHSTTSGMCSPGCTPDGNWDSGSPNSPPRTFSHTFPTAGTFHYYCRQHLSMMQGTVIVNP
jgi:hypothetical protein